MDRAQVQDILINEQGARDVVRRLFPLFKAANPRMSLWNIGKRLRIRAKGNLSEIMRGKRLLPLAHRYQLGELFLLNPGQARLFAVLVERDHSPVGSIWREQLERELAAIRKSLAIQILDHADPIMTEDPWVFELVASFGLFKCKPRASDLARHFGRVRWPRIKRVLDSLVDCGAIDWDGKVYRLARLQSYLRGPAYRKVNEAFVAAGLNETLSGLSDLYADRRQAIVRSACISVRREDYVKALESLRSSMDQWEASVESEDADAVIRVSLQAYPI